MPAASSVSRRPVTPDAASCLRARAPGSKCRRCLDACPAECIAIGAGTLRIGPGCVGCGACHVVCPTGALRDASTGDAALAARASRLATPRFHCSLAAPDRESVRVTCLARLSAAVHLELARLGARAVELIRGDCERCAARRAREVAAEQVTKTVVECFARLGREPPGIRERCLSAAGDQPDGCSRRAFLGGLARRRNRQAGGAAAALRAVLGAWGVDEVELRHAPVGRVVLQGACDACGACARVCPTGALVAHKAGGRFELAVDSGRCSGCGLCARVCARDALRVDRVWERCETPRVLAEFRPASCAGCGAPVPRGDELCISCRRRGGRAT